MRNVLKLILNGKEIFLNILGICVKGYIDNDNENVFVVLVSF